MAPGPQPPGVPSMPRRRAFALGSVVGALLAGLALVAVFHMGAPGEDRGAELGGARPQVLGGDRAARFAGAQLQALRTGLQRGPPPMSARARAAKAEDQAAKRERRKRLNAILDELFDQIEGEKRDLALINELLDRIGGLKPEAVAPALKGDWKLVFVDSAEAIDQVGSGLGKLPGSSIEDLFASFDVKGGVRIQEVVRVVGPFPSVRNLLSGTWEYQDKTAGFAGDSVSEPRLVCTYTEMVDGRNMRTTLSTGFKQKDVELDVRYVDADVLVAFIRNEGLQPLRLVFEKELELEKELGRLLRTDLTKEAQPGAGGPVNPIVAIAEIAKGDGKKPWEFWK